MKHVLDMGGLLFMPHAELVCSPQRRREAERQRKALGNLKDSLPLCLSAVKKAQPVPVQSILIEYAFSCNRQSHSSFKLLLDFEIPFPYLVDHRINEQLQEK